jgi:hypothetical protein
MPLQSAASWVMLSLLVFSSHMLSHQYNRFHFKFPALFTHLFLAAKWCKVSRQGARSALRMSIYHVQSSSGDCLVSSSTTTRKSNFLVNWNLLTVEVSVCDYCHWCCNTSVIRSYAEKQDRWYYGEMDCFPIQSLVVALFLMLFCIYWAGAEV